MRPTTDDPYAVLGVARGAAADDIRRAWLALARRHHPDRGGDAGTMQAVNEAWSVLGDPDRRRAWDREHGIDSPAEDAAGTTARPGRFDDDAEDEWDDDVDLLDPRPLATPVPSALGILPVLIFAAAVATGCLALVFDAPAMIGFAVFLFFLSCVAIAAAAMLTMRRSVRAGRR